MCTKNQPRENFRQTPVGVNSGSEFNSSINIWDLATRINHWLLTVLVCTLLISGFAGLGDRPPHMAAGLLLTCAIVWRWLWGFWGSHTARFSQFVKGPVTVFHYFCTIFKGNKTKVAIGHNPAGGWMVMTMLVLLTCQVITGMHLGGIIDLMIIMGSTADKLVGVTHGVVACLLVFCIVAHLIAIAVYQLKGQRLVRAMVTGKLDSSDISSNREPVFASNIKVIITLVVALGLVGLLLLTIN
ncbi:cytochrome b/b6 domain-containing protein [Spartinivicinus poritis]|uniref:Cytochrome b/b6 domain-containing protein n=1 Tax=Spartinivicinus poritis TaxID=2994640 RepID=A0ABT5U649_9GAMM|nr:cytochrome b/b6 domain-containing protein [Spartinivicinus sp. A2-2]MDE1461655.1 cytochrome b/b6 domain-containing protein [Spartinivicinus sp. A2-2]